MLSKESPLNQAGMMNQAGVMNQGRSMSPARLPGDKREISFFVSGIKHYENSYYSNSPSSFAALSLTGSACDLRCAHCDGILLRSMRDASSAERFIACVDKASDAGRSGLLISGGADRDGAVPILPRINEIAYAKEKGLKIVIHTGLIDRKTAFALKSARVDRVMFDVIASPDAIRDVYGISRTPDDYFQSMSYCTEAGLEVAPHIVVGLNYGRVDGEYEAIDMVRRAGAKILVLVILVPRHGTRMENTAPPKLSDVAEVFKYASDTLKNTSLALGCARPVSYAGELEKLAIDLGFKAIAYPHDEAIQYAEKQGLKTTFKEECCCLLSV